MALKARLLLFEASKLVNPSNDAAKWQAAADAAKAVIEKEAQAGYDLFGDYRKLFLPANEHSCECVFNIEFSKTKNTAVNSFNVYSVQYRNNAPLLDLVMDYRTTTDGAATMGKYDNLDPRFAATNFYPGSTFLGKANCPAGEVCQFTGFAHRKLTIYDAHKRRFGRQQRRDQLHVHPLRRRAADARRGAERGRRHALRCRLRRREPRARPRRHAHLCLRFEEPVRDARDHPPRAPRRFAGRGAFITNDTTAAVGVTADGVVGRQTWYKISYIYVSVKDLAELTSEGETSNGTLSDGTWGGTVLRTGSTGSAVEQLQFWLNTLAQYDSSIHSVTVDGVFGSGTAAAVRAFQRKYGLTVDGVVGRTTWTEVYDQFRSIQSDNGTPNAYPGTALREGSSGQNVRLVQFWLKIARTVYTSLANVTVDGKFGAGTAAAVQRFQRYFGLTADGVVGRTTWQKLYEVYNDIANRLLSPSLRPGEYPGVLRTGSSGTAVRELQFYHYLMSAYESSIPR